MRSEPTTMQVHAIGAGGVAPGTRWRLRFWAIFGGQGLSLVGSSLTQFVLLWWITDTTGSVSALATAGLAAMLPQALLSPLGGTLADRYSRRLLMIAADAVSAIGCAGYQRNANRLGFEYRRHHGRAGHCASAFLPHSADRGEKRTGQPVARISRRR